MIPRLHPKGHSFAGVAAYVLHDKDHASTSDRVGWAETRNMATDDPHVAARVMAATAMDQDRLKAEAGVKNTGRKSVKSVLHASIAWHRDEADTLTREEKERAALGFLKAIGAEDHQAIIAEHTDEEHPHLHLIINRVHPETGKMLSSSKEKLKLSAWAQEYEQERGEILCEQRAINNAARARGEFTRATGWKTREQFERDRDAANDNQQDSGRTERLAELAQRGRDMAARHAEAFAELEKAHKERLVQIKEAARRAATIERDAVREEFRPQWEYRFHDHQAQVRAFERDEGDFQGRMKNRLRSIDFAGMMKAGDRKRAITESFRALGSSGARLEALRRSQEAANRVLAKQQREEENTAVRSVTAAREAQLQEQRQHFLAQRSSLVLTQDMERAELRAGWHEMNTDRDRSPRGRRAEDHRATRIRKFVERKEGERSGSGDGGRPRKPQPEHTPDVGEQFEHAAAAPEPEDIDKEDERAKRIREFVAKKEFDRAQQNRDPEPEKDREIGD